MTTREAALEKALREYRREMENPAKDLALRIIRRRELFAAHDAFLATQTAPAEEAISIKAAQEAAKGTLFTAYEMEEAAGELLAWRKGYNAAKEDAVMNIGLLRRAQDGGR